MGKGKAKVSAEMTFWCWCVCAYVVGGCRWCIEQMHVERKVRKEVVPQQGSTVALRNKAISRRQTARGAHEEEQATSLPSNWFPLPFKVFTSFFFLLFSAAQVSLRSCCRFLSTCWCGRLPVAIYFVCEYARLRLVDVATLWQLIACNCSCCTSKSSAKLYLWRVACREGGSRFLTHFFALPVAR